jgi:phage gp36-like protein
MSTAWIVIVASDLDDYLVAAQMEAIRTAALGSGQTDPFARVMPDVAQRIRAEIEACATNSLSATVNSIPPSLKRHACALIIEAMQPRILLPLTEDQQQAAKDAKEWLKRIAECEIKVEVPPDPIESTFQQAGQIEVVRKTDRVATRETMGGL